ncbi:MAG: PIG-L family deacetylase [Clostridia bacterium]|nr:PIG-L family deacetylase [Clostridia bacterium]
MRILSVMCHPDDMELQCGGTLLKYKQQGHDVIACNVANGNMGHLVIMPDELREIRLKEAQNACKIAGFEHITADIGDLAVNSADPKQIEKMVRIIRYANPDVIITHDPNDYHSDHVETSKLLFNSAYSATCPHFMPELGEVAGVMPIYYADTSAGVNFIPAEYVDITDVVETKIEMMKCHKSQLDWLLEHDGYDPVAQMRTRAGFWGLQCGVEYAEVFRPALMSGRMRPYRVLP